MSVEGRDINLYDVYRQNTKYSAWKILKTNRIIVLSFRWHYHIHVWSVSIRIDIKFYSTGRFLLCPKGVVALFDARQKKTLQNITFLLNKTFTIFSRVPATLQPTLSVGRSVGLLVTLCFFSVFGGFGVTAPAQLPSWFISSLPQPTRTRLG